MKYIDKSYDLLFETSWEVCNKIGGIYTVLSTKANTLQKLNKDKNIFIGPDVWSTETPSPYFVESDTLLKDWKFQNHLPEGLNIRVGRWDIPGKPIVILVDYKGLFGLRDQLYARMWEKFEVDSLHAYGDYDESCIFAYGAALVIEDYVNWLNNKNTAIIAHFDEWTTGMGLLYLKEKTPQIATVFTTHATSIGRSICGNNKPLYDYMSGYNGDQMAGELNMESKHSLEKKAAHNADCFTTVSDVTAVECKQLLECEANPVTPNGFEQNFVPSKTKYPAARKQARATMLNVASKLLGYNVSDDTFIIVTSGRNEFRNKGLDVFIDSVNTLRSKNVNRKVIAFVMVPAWVAGPREDLKNSIENNTESQFENKIITHNLNNCSSDSIIKKIQYLNLVNCKEDNVKIIYVPCYLNGDDGIFNLSYYDLLPGVDATTFASYYEPWGYTPLESIAFGIPTISTDLSGFGQWILSNYENEFEKSGTKIIHRTDSNYSNVVNEIADALVRLINSDNKSIRTIRETASKIAKEASWKNFIEYYNIAYKKALTNLNGRNKK